MFSEAVLYSLVCKRWNDVVFKYVTKVKQSELNKISKYIIPKLINVDIYDRDLILMEDLYGHNFKKLKKLCCISDHYFRKYMSFLDYPQLSNLRSLRIIGFEAFIMKEKNWSILYDNLEELYINPDNYNNINYIVKSLNNFKNLKLLHFDSTSITIKNIENYKIDLSNVNINKLSFVFNYDIIPGTDNFYFPSILQELTLSFYYYELDSIYDIIYLFSKNNTTISADIHQKRFNIILLYDNYDQIVFDEYQQKIQWKTCIKLMNKNNIEYDIKFKFDG